MMDATREQLRSAGDGGELGRHLALLIAITQEFAASLDIDETLKTTAARIRELLDAEASSLFLLEDGPEGRQLICRACAGPIDITGLRLDIHQGIVGKTIRNKHPLMVRDVRADPDFAQSVDRSTGFVTRSILSVPLRVKDHCLGALELLNKKSHDGLFDLRDKEVSMALAASAALAIHNARMAGALVEQERMRHELALAAVIQRSLLPTGAMEPGADLDSGPIAGLNIPARSVSGDFFDYMTLDDGRIAFNIADVAGKGMDAALLMAKTSSLLRCLGKRLTRPDELVAQVNDELCETAVRGKFVTLVAGVLDPRNGLVRFANAGHQPPLLHRVRHGGNDEFIEFPAAAPPLGVLPGLRFPVTELTLGDSALYLFTDGLTEAKDQDGRMVGDTGIRKAIQRAATLEKHPRLQAIVEITAGSAPHQQDDITLLVLETAPAIHQDSETMNVLSR